MSRSNEGVRWGPSANHHCSGTFKYQEKFDQSGAYSLISLKVSFHHDFIRVKQRVKRDIGKNRVKVILVK